MGDNRYMSLKYSHLVGHNIKAIIKNKFPDNDQEREYKGYVTKVSLNANNQEIIYVRENTGELTWFLPCHSNLEIISLKILDPPIKYTKYNRWEIMDI